MNSKNLVDHFPALRLFFFFEAGLNRTREGNVRVKRCEVGDGLDGPTLLLRSAVGGIDGQREKEKESKWWCRLSQRRTFCSKVSLWRMVCLKKLSEFSSLVQSRGQLGSRHDAWHLD